MTQDVQALLDEAVRHHGAGRLLEAEDIYRRILSHDPGHAEALYLWAVVAYQSKNLAAADELIAKAIAIDSGVDRYLNLQGLVRKAQGRPQEAEETLRRALALAPDSLETLNNLGAVLKDMNRLAEAEETYGRVLALKPDQAAAHYNLANVLKDQGRVREAEAAYLKTLEIQPEFAGAHYNLGVMFKDRGQCDKAIAAYRRAIAIEPTHADAHHNLGLALLLDGEWEEGWTEYEWRWRQSYLQQRPFPQASWEGSPLSGKTILVWGEQGLGDEIRFAALVPDLIRRGATVVIECEPRLAPLFARSFPGVECVARSDPPHPRLLSESMDFQTSSGGPCRWLRADLASFPTRRGYLAADAGRVRELRRRYSDGGKPLVGISWASSAKIRDVAWPPLPAWYPVFAAPGVTFIDLQYGDTAADRAVFLEHTGVDLVHDGTIDPLADMDAFAAQVAAMDLVISVGNSTVEVAGALGVPVWTLAPFDSNWVWMRDREDSPWYPSMRLFRQRARGDWESVMADVADSLRRKVAER